ncbi:MAG: hypothetical protein K2X41_02815, partial [Hyphomicrobium sp.]|nr:hypothetical protein [Hyphomicrobium sp.]
MISILLDTSFLITLADPARPNHPTALRYLREALAQGAPLYLSAIVASELLNKTVIVSTATVALQEQ